MTPNTLQLSNKQARHLWLHVQGMSRPPCGKRQTRAFAERVAELGMVQLDAIGILSRAHHHILWSRQSAYRPVAFDHMLTRDRSVFEHFSHDAVILPISTYPHWQRQRQRRANAYGQAVWGGAYDQTGIHQTVIQLIEERGPLSSRDLAFLQKGPVDKNQHAWARPEHKNALEYLWLKGDLSISHRKNFTKHYDLTHRIIPEEYQNAQISDTEQIHWLCESALSRLGFASAGEIQRFWDACTLDEVRLWLERAGDLIRPVQYADAKGNLINAVALTELIDRWFDSDNCLHTKGQLSIPQPCSRLRIVNPFDPIVRDRERLARLFGFDFRIEIYTPKHKRRYGYYVYPILEGDRMIGRIDVRADKANDQLTTTAWWLEPGVKETLKRVEKLQAELQRLAALAGVSGVGTLGDASSLA